MEKIKRKYIQISYRKTRVSFRLEDIPEKFLRPEFCPSCHTKPNRWHFHHWLYAYKTKEVKENRELVFENGVWLCYNCHKMFADHWRWIVYWTRKNPRLGMGVMKLMPIEFKRTLAQYFVEMILK